MFEMEPLQINSTLRGRYRIREFVGKGGMGYVYKAEDTYEKRTVAIKEMRQGSFSPSELAHRQALFEQEADILKKITPHPHLPQIYESFSENGRSYLVMEFIVGQTLKKLVEQSRTAAQQLPVENVLNYALQLCEVLSYLHRQSPPIVFRDLKPDNVMVKANGYVYLIDFGIARYFKPDQLMDTHLFRAEGYAAPELISYGRTEPRSDLYCLGATLHNCLTGQEPVPAGPSQFKFESIRIYNQQVPTRLNNLIQRLVATKPERRPENAKIVSHQLREIKHAISDPTVELDDEDLTYYDITFARAAQLIRQWLPLNQLPGILGKCYTGIMYFCAVIGAWLLYSPFCRDIWERIARLAIKGIHVISAVWNFLKRGGPARRGPGRPGPPPPRPPVPPRQHLSLLERIAHLMRTVGHIFMQQSPVFVGLPFITVGGSICMLMLFHSSPYIVLFALALLMLLLAFGASVRQKIHGSTQSILTMTMIAMFVVCIALLAQPDVQGIVKTITLNQLLSLLIISLGLSSLLRAAQRVPWIDQAAISVTAGACALQQYVLGSQEMQFMSPDAESTMNFLVVAILVIVAIVALFLLLHPFGKKSRVMISIVVVACLFLQAAFGMQDLGSLRAILSWNLSTLNWILIAFLGGITLLSLYLSDQGPLLRVSRIPLFLLTVFCTLLQLFLGANIYRFPSATSLNVLTTKLLDPEHVDQFVPLGLALVAAMLAYSLIRRSQHLFINCIGVICIGLVCVLLQLSQWSDPLPPSIAMACTYLVPLVEVSVVIVLVLTVMSTLLQLIQRGNIPGALSNTINQLLLLCGRIIVGLSAFTCILFIVTFSGKAGFLQSTIIPFQGGSLTSGEILLGVIVLAAFIIVCKSLYALHCFLSAFNQRNRLQAIAKPNAFKRFMLAFFDDRYSMLIVSFNLLMLWGIQGRQLFGGGLLPSWAIVNLSLSWRFVIFGLLIAVGVSFFWLRRPFGSSMSTMLKFIFIVAGVCTLLSCVGIVGGNLFPWTTPLSMIVAIIGLLLLIHGVLMASWTEREIQERAI